MESTLRRSPARIGFHAPFLLNSLTTVTTTQWSAHPVFNNNFEAISADILDYYFVFTTRNLRRENSKSIRFVSAENIRYFDPTGSNNEMRATLQSSADET